MKKYNTVLTIAGSDSGGGAGIQADIKTISACGCYASSAITAVTVQNTLGVSAVHPVPVDIIEGQIESVLSDIGADAIKLGMLNTSDVIECVGRQIDKYSVHNVVLDPVMVSTSGHRLMEESAMTALMQVLIPKVRVITPNIPEAEILLASIPGYRDVTLTRNNICDAARALAQHFGVSVLLKGGHLADNQLVDIFIDNEADEIYELPSVRVDTLNTHGTGCTLSSAFASMLAKGMSLSDSARAAKEYINNAIMAGAGYRIGQGHGPVNHFYAYFDRL